MLDVVFRPGPIEIDLWKSIVFHLRRWTSTWHSEWDERIALLFHHHCVSFVRRMEFRLDQRGILSDVLLFSQSTVVTLLPSRTISILSSTRSTASSISFPLDSKRDFPDEFDEVRSNSIVRRSTRFLFVSVSSKKISRSIWTSIFVDRRTNLSSIILIWSPAKINRRCSTISKKCEDLYRWTTWSLLVAF